MKSRRIVFPGFAIRRSLMAIAVLAVVVMAGCSSTFVISKWRTEQIKVDGDSRDWNDSTSYFGNDDVGIKVTNDEEYLYLLLVTQKREIARQMVTRGLTVWFDPNGGDKKTIGLHYPVGMMGGAGRFRQEENGPPQGMEQGNDASARGMQEFEFFGPTDRDRVRLPRMQGKGIEVRIAEHDTRFVYEARIPLIFSLDHPYAIETSTGSTIGVTIEATTAAREAVGGGDQGGGAPGGGRGGGGGGGRGIGGGGGGRGGRGGIGGGGGGQGQRSTEGAQFEPIKVKLHLAEQSAQKQ
jgi:hypothetical protein